MSLKSSSSSRSDGTPLYELQISSSNGFSDEKELNGIIPDAGEGQDEHLEARSLMEREFEDKLDSCEETLQTEKIKYPVSVFYVIVSVFCEYFSFLGIRTILTLYFRDMLGYDDNLSTIMYHVFVMLCYSAPVCGAILADGYLGKFTAIVSVSIFYLIGEIILTVSSIPGILPQKPFSLIALFIIALGSGGIKPCVVAFGGDQFVRPQQDKQLETYFSIFFCVLNAGILASTFVTPMFRDDFQCFGMDSCFPLAFGIAGVVLVISIAIFVSGKSRYQTKRPEGNVLLEVCGCIGHAISRKWRLRKTGTKHDHWLDFAGDKYGQRLIQDVKQVLRILVLYLPVPIFNALFVQQGSRWTLQATRMDGGFGEDSWALKADQMQILNPLMNLFLVPIFDSLIYPLFSKCNLLTPLQRMAGGGIMAAMAFIVSAILELQLEPTYAKIPGAGLAQLDFYNTLPCPAHIHFFNRDLSRIEMNATSRFKLGEYPDFIESGSYEIGVSLQLIEGKCGTLDVIGNRYNTSINAEEQKSFSVLISMSDGLILVQRMESEAPLEKSPSGSPRVGFILDKFVSNSLVNISLNGKASDALYTATGLADENGVVQIELVEVGVGSYTIKVWTTDGDPITFADDVTFEIGGVYVNVIQIRDGNGIAAWNYEMTPPNSVHMLWLIPQYFFITVGEILMSVTGVQFSFTQAPSSMRSVMQAMWHLTMAFGNLIVIIIITQAKGFSKQSDEFFLFAGLMALDMIWFTLLATRYEYISEDEEKKEARHPPKQQRREQSLPSQKPKKDY